MNRLRYLASIAALALAAAGLLVPAAASAATITPGSAAAATPTPASADASGTVTGTILGTSAACTSHWAWHVSWPPTGGYSEVEWTSNPCGFRIQDRSRCEPPVTGGAHYNTSGIVRGTHIWAKAGCGITETISWAQKRIEKGTIWSGWTRYWTRP